MRTPGGTIGSLSTVAPSPPSKTIEDRARRSLLQASRDLPGIAVAKLSSVQLPPKSPGSRSYRPDIDGLRSLAILSVVLFHAGVASLSGGFTGVDIFFVISGYLIGGHIDAELATGTFSFLHFYRNRAKRILPALYFVVVAVLCLGIPLLSPRELRALAMYAFATVGSASNIALWRSTSYFAHQADQNPLLMTWSLGIEEQFYLVVPLLLVIIARLRAGLKLPLLLGISVLSFATAVFQVRHHPNAAFYLLESRAWELGVGVLLAMVPARSAGLGAKAPATAYNTELRAFFGALLLLGPFFLLAPTTPFPGIAALPSVFGAALLLSTPDSIFNRKVLSQPALVFIGRISFSLYLVHWPLFSFLRILRGDTLPQSWGLGAAVVAFGLALLSYFLIEVPFRSSSRPAKSLLLRYATISLFLLGLSGAIFLTNGLPSRYVQAAAVDAVAAAAVKANHDPCLAEQGETHPRLTAACTGSSLAGDHIALWGDSHASAISSSLRDMSHQQGLFVEEYTKTNCPPLLGVGRSYRADPAVLKECVAFNSSVLDRLVHEPGVHVVLLEAYWDAPFDPYSNTGKLATASMTTDATTDRAEVLFGSALSLTLSKLVASGKQVVIFGDTPVFEVDPLWRMRTSAIPLRRWLVTTFALNTLPIDAGQDQSSDSTAPQRSAQALLEQLAAAHTGVSFWSMRALLCKSEAACSYRVEHRPLFIDTNHVSPEGARFALNGWQVPMPGSTPPGQGSSSR